MEIKKRKLFNPRVALTTSAKAALNAVEDLLGSSKLNEVRASRTVSTCFLNEVSSGLAEAELLDGMDEAILGTCPEGVRNL